VITLDGVGVRYGTSCALDGVSEQVPAGQWLGVIGPNGAGKTTLLRSIAHLVPHAGTITIDGQPVSGLRRRRLARLVAYVPQLPGLPPEMTVGDYVLLGRTPHIGYLRMETAADRQICADLLDRLGLSPMAGRILATLSGGELQRVVLARALAQEAPVLLLDEPTSALDLGRRVDALELIDELRTTSPWPVSSPTGCCCWTRAGSPLPGRRPTCCATTCSPRDSAPVSTS
jgi:iron complex transport system ATP-binding protein